MNSKSILTSDQRDIREDTNRLNDDLDLPENLQHGCISNLTAT